VIAWRRAAVCTLACVATGTVCAQVLPAGTAECLERIDRQTLPTDGDRPEPPLLGEVCPEIVDDINDGIWGQALARGLAEDLSGAAFVTLTDVVAEYDSARAAIAISPATLDAALAETATLVPPTELSIWERAMQWLQERLGRAPDDGASGFERWLAQWLEDFSVSERWLTVALALIGIVLVIATALIVVNELRAAGLLVRRTPRGAAADDGAALGAELPRVRTIDDLRRAPLSRQPALLLALVLELLRQRSPIPHSATHRELLARTDLRTEQRATFATVVGAAERATFGGWQPAPTELTELLAGGESLIRDLSVEDGAPR
jgi:hypothetical protein